MDEEIKDPKRPEEVKDSRMYKEKILVKLLGREQIEWLRDIGAREPPYRERPNEVNRGYS